MAAARSKWAMCTRYISPETREIEAFWHIGGRMPNNPFPTPRKLFPLTTAPFLRNAADDGLLELACDHWA